MSNIKHASIVMQKEEGSIVQQPVTADERRFILSLPLNDNGNLSVTCKGIVFTDEYISPVQ